MKDRFPDEYKKMEAEINKPRPKGESYNNEPKAQELSIQQQDGYRKRPRMQNIHLLPPLWCMRHH